MLKDVRVLHGGNHTHYYLTVRDDRLAQFYDFILEHRSSLTAQTSEELLPGVSAAAVTGLSAIFTNIPNKFPIQDIITFLRADMMFWRCPEEVVKLPEVTAALVRFGQSVPLGVST